MDRFLIISSILITLMESVITLPSVREDVFDQYTKIRRTSQNVTRVFGQAESENGTSASYLNERNKLIISTANQTDVNSAKSSPPFMFMLILIVAILVIIGVISTALCVMRRRFYKWRLTLVPGTSDSDAAVNEAGQLETATEEQNNTNDQMVKEVNEVTEQKTCDEQASCDEKVKLTSNIEEAQPSEKSATLVVTSTSAEVEAN